MILNLIPLDAGGLKLSFCGGGDPFVKDPPDVDAARNDFLQDAFYSQRVNKVGFVKGVGQASVANPRTTPGGSTYHTDGLRAVMFYGTDPVSLTEIEFIGWERLIDHRQR